MIGLAVAVDDPKHRFLRVIQAVKLGIPVHNPDMHEEGLWRVLSGVPDSPYDVQYACAVQYDAMKREFVESLLLAGATDEDVFETLSIPRTVTETYRHLFFDTGVFRDRVDRIRYAFSYPKDVDQGRAALRKQEAVERGLVYMKASLGGPDISLNPADVARLLMYDAFMFGAQAAHHPLNSAMAKEARTWGVTAIRHAAALNALPDLEQAQQSQASMVNLIKTFQHDVSDVASRPDMAPVGPETLIGYTPTIGTQDGKDDK